MSEVRHDPLTGDSVIIAPERGERPHSNGSDEPTCPFCPGSEDETPEPVLQLSTDASESWFVRVVPNLFPIVSPTSDENDGADGRVYVAGAHEVIVETPLHDQEMYHRSLEEVQLTLAAYRHRLNAHLGTPGIRHVSIFQNRGPGAGASLDHPHSQVVALSYVPAAVGRQVRRWRRHLAQTGACLLCDELLHEREDGSRVVEDTGDFLLLAPFGAVRPGEMVLAPLQHHTSFGVEDDDALRQVSDLLLSALTRMHDAFEKPSHNLVLQTWPKARRPDVALHWYLRIIPRRAEIGGFELSTGDFVSSLSSEDAVAMYRENA